ncbi:MAG TPA: hypothetical protein VGF75_04065, partial [Candidatus Saccharimonadales bacterium]
SPIVIGNDLSPLKTPPNSYLGTISIDGQTVNMVYSNLSDILTVNEIKSSALSTTELQGAVYQKLRTDGYNPYLINMTFNVNVIP